MTWTVSKFARSFLTGCSLFVVATQVSAIGIHPALVTDRNPPGMYGPAQMSVEYSDALGMFWDPKYINNIGPYDAFSLEFGFGAAEFRGAFTWGHVLCRKHFFKASLEYFAEDPNFVFLSGVESQWVGQQGYGFDYMFLPDYLLGIYSFHLGLFYTYAESENLNPVPFMAQTDFRRVAGGRDIAGIFGVSIEPWYGAHFDLDARQDSVKFFNKNIKQATVVGLGFTVAYTQRFGDNFTMLLKGTKAAPYYEYVTRFTTLVDTAPGDKIEIYLQYVLDSGTAVPISREDRYGLGVSYSWGGNKYRPRESYTDPLELNLTDKLVEYSNNPAVRPPQVIARVDEVLN